MKYDDRRARVTVLMPVFNGEKYVATAIQSILRQTFRDFVLLVIDDGSSDSSVAIVQSFGDCRIRLVRNRENIGIVETLNRGLDLVETELVARMDCDDVALPERIEKQVAFLEQNADVGMCGTAYELFHESFRQTIRPPCGHEEIVYGLLEDNVFLHSSVMIRMSVLNAWGLRYDGRYRHAEDYELWTRLSRYTRLGNLPEVLVRYRSHPENISNTNKAEQIATRDKVRLEHLKSFGLALDAAHKALHIDLLSFSFRGSAFQLSEARKWLETLACAISARCKIPIRRLYRDFSPLWYSACGRSAHHGLTVLWSYLNSPIAWRGSKIYIFKLFFRCLTRQPIPVLAK
ncbi:MAG TPA: glycosyltransferase [Methylococcus sp.]|nr:glycosyltransferase [Methylococcus sp.]